MLATTKQLMDEKQILSEITRAMSYQWVANLHLMPKLGPHSDLFDLLRVTNCLPFIHLPFHYFRIVKLGWIFNCEIFNHFFKKRIFISRWLHPYPSLFTLLLIFRFLFYNGPPVVEFETSSTLEHMDITRKTRPTPHLRLHFLLLYLMSWQEEMTMTYHLKTPATQFQEGRFIWKWRSSGV